jgi:hypothetical protein
LSLASTIGSVGGGLAQGFGEGGFKKKEPLPGQAKKGVKKVKLKRKCKGCAGCKSCK